MPLHIFYSGLPPTSILFYINVSKICGHYYIHMMPLFWRSYFRSRHMIDSWTPHQGDLQGLQLISNITQSHSGVHLSFSAPLCYYSAFKKKKSSVFVAA